MILLSTAWWQSAAQAQRIHECQLEQNPPETPAPCVVLWRLYKAPQGTRGSHTSAPSPLLGRLAAAALEVRGTLVTILRVVGWKRSGGQRRAEREACQMGPRWVRGRRGIGDVGDAPALSAISVHCGLAAPPVGGLAQCRPAPWQGGASSSAQGLLRVLPARFRRARLIRAGAGQG
ncbi:unnamed protein product [Prorocentrum cordatum]|uniref:Uncharacterized protein n=1 Tax=Prorocentrum cordatum TaxID=2364126 RepID=A0ABN9X3S5_9DINO|nr:unnamed protein product [Polarella glacialis]